MLVEGLGLRTLEVSSCKLKGLVWQVWPMKGWLMFIFCFFSCALFYSYQDIVDKGSISESYIKNVLEVGDHLS